MLPTSIGEGEKFSIKTLVRTINSIKNSGGNRLSGHGRSRFSGIVKFQSNFDGFAIGILVPQTGIALHNRASGFTLEFGHPNPITSAKRPFHLIIPSFLPWDDGTFDGRTDAPQVPR
ncbi:MAG: gamma-glutamyltransferase [Microcystis aeruginosa]